MQSISYFRYVQAVVGFGIFILFLILVMGFLGNAKSSGENVENVEIYIGNETIDKVSKKGQIEWRSLKGNNFNIGYTKKTAWVKIERKEWEGNKYVEIDYKQLDSVNLYQFSSAGTLVNMAMGGDRIDKHLTSANSDDLIFEISEASETLYFKIKTVGSMQGRFRLFTAENVLVKEDFIKLLVHVYIGLCVFSIVFCVFWGKEYSERLYLYYVCMNMAIAGILFFHYKYSRLYFGSDVGIEEPLTVFCVTASAISAGLYALRTLGTMHGQEEKYWRREKILMALGILLVLMGFALSYEHGLWMAFIFLAVIGVYGTLSIGSAWFKEYGSVEQLTLSCLAVGWGFYLVGGFSQLLSEIAIIKNQDLGLNHGTLVGAIGISLSLAITLSLRIRGEFRKTAADLAEKTNVTQRILIEDRVDHINKMSMGLIHELRNPLASMGSGMTILLMDVDDTERVRKYANRTMEGMTIINNILNALSEYVSGNELKEKEPFNFFKMVNKTIDFAGADIKQVADIKITVSEDMWVDGSETHIQQLMINLISNAATAIEKNRKHVSDLGEKGVIRITGEETNGDVVVTIEDNGVGMSEDMRNRVFTPFVTSNKDNGTRGLGMFISQDIVQRHNGKIEVESKEGEGTKVTITLKGGAYCLA